MEVIPSRFAEMCMVSPAAISKKIKSGTLILNSGGKLDTDNPINRQYLAKKQLKFKAGLNSGNIEAMTAKQGFSLAAQSAGVLPELAIQSSHVSTVDIGDELQASGAAGEALNMTLRELVIKYGNGTINGVERYSKILRDLVTADEKDQKLQERRLLQIPKDFVVSRIFGFVDQLMNKLLDVPEAVSDQVIALALSGDESTRRQSVINVLGDNITRCIAGCKEHIIAELNGLKGKYEKQEEDSVAAIADLNDRLDLLQGENV